MKNTNKRKRDNNDRKRNRRTNERGCTERKKEGQYKKIMGDTHKRKVDNYTDTQMKKNVVNRQTKGKKILQKEWATIVGTSGTPITHAWVRKRLSSSLSLVSFSILLLNPLPTYISFYFYICFFYTIATSVFYHLIA